MSEEWLVASFDDDDWPIDYNHLKKIQDSDLGYVISDLHIEKIVQGQKLLELLEKKIEELKNPVNSVVPDSSDMIPEPSHKLWELQKHLSFEDELQKLLEDSKK